VSATVNFNIGFQATIEDGVWVASNPGYQRLLIDMEARHQEFKIGSSPNEDVTSALAMIEFIGGGTITDLSPATDTDDIIPGRIY